MAANNNNTKRLMFVMILFFVVLSVIIARLIDLQIVSGTEYYEKSERKQSSSYSITASRGEMLDRYGNPLVANTQVFKIRFYYVYWNRERQNDVILNLCKLVKDGKSDYVDTLPVSDSPPFEFYSSESSDYEKLMSFLRDEGIFSEVETNSGELSAEDTISALSERYKIDENLSDAEKRMIAGVRYEMERRSFSIYNNTFTFAEDVGIDIISKIKENGSNFPGVKIDVSPIREYRTQNAAHILGRVGPIYKEEYAEYKAKGYPMDTIIGKDGLERSLEEWLRGIDGRQTAVTDGSGNIVDEKVTKEPQPGSNCILTIDLALQNETERSLAANIEKIKATGSSADIEGGAAVVIDVNSGEILAMASYPTYNLSTFGKDYKNLLENELSPMFNRAIAGTYSPGSTFKMVTALAGLEENVIQPDTIIEDTGIYMYYAPQYTPRCWYYKDYGKVHGKINVAMAIKYSCNYFFYEVGRLLGIETLNRYAGMLGLGKRTGIELSGEAAGILAGPEHRAATGGAEWQPGETIQAAIGQTEQLCTPLQLAAYVATLVNGGTYYKPHLLKAVSSYDYSRILYENNPEVVDKIDIEPANYNALMEGMRSVTEDGTASSVFRNFEISVGGKTGSAQTTPDRSAHGVFVAFAPYENPEIAVCVVGEHAGSGNRMAWVAKDIFRFYFNSHGNMTEVSEENVLLR